MSALPDDPDPTEDEIRDWCAQEVPPHRYWEDGSDGQGGIAGRCFCGDKTDYPVGGPK